MTQICGPYYRTGHYIRGKNERVVLMVDCWNQHGEAERNALTSDLIDFLNKRDEERAPNPSTSSASPPTQRSRNRT